MPSLSPDVWGRGMGGRALMTCSVPRLLSDVWGLPYVVCCLPLFGEGRGDGAVHRASPRSE